MKKINENLTDQELFVLKDKGTERPFTGKFDSLKSWNFRSNAYQSLGHNGFLPRSGAVRQRAL